MRISRIVAAGTIVWLFLPGGPIHGQVPARAGQHVRAAVGTAARQGAPDQLVSMGQGQAVALPPDHRPGYAASAPTLSEATPALVESLIYLPVSRQADPLLIAAIRRTMELEDRMLVWDWEAGVALAGLLAARDELSDEAGDQLVLDYVEQWVYARISEGETFIDSDRELPDCGAGTWPAPGVWHPNHATPAWATYMLHEHRPHEELEQIVTSAIRFLRRDACRLDGAIAHMPGQVWADTLMVAVPLIARYGAATGDSELVDFACEQVLLHARLLQDEATGLWYHGWRSEPGDHMSGAFWARGNGWAALAMSELLLQLPEGHRDRESIRMGLLKQLSGLIEHQDDSGLWHTVVTRPDFYLETSGSAAIATAMLRAVRAGWVDDEDRDRLEAAGLLARQAVRRRVALDGSVTGVSAGTGVGEKIEDYAHIRTDLAQGYGQGLFLLMSSVGTDN